MVQEVMMLMELLLPLVYIVLSLTAIASRYYYVPVLRTMSSHGKMRMTRRTTSSMSSSLLLNSKYMWVPKRWFCHFYIFGLLMVMVVGGDDDDADGFNYG